MLVFFFKIRLLNKFLLICFLLVISLIKYLIHVTKNIVQIYRIAYFENEMNEQYIRNINT